MSDKMVNNGYVSRIPQDLQGGGSGSGVGVGKVIPVYFGVNDVTITEGGSTSFQASNTEGVYDTTYYTSDENGERLPVDLDANKNYVMFGYMLDGVDTSQVLVSYNPFFNISPALQEITLRVTIYAISAQSRKNLYFAAFIMEI